MMHSHARLTLFDFVVLSNLLPLSLTKLEREMDSDMHGGDSIEKIKGLSISSLENDLGEEQEEAEAEGLVVENLDDDDDEQEEDPPVTLGFLEKAKCHWSLLRQLFPSKAGGVPAWLDPINLPSGKSCLCDVCGEPLQFSLQVYAPISNKESTFHRALFVFMCPSMSCLLRDQREQWKRRPEKPSRSVKVFRCQLPCINPFYSSEPPRHNGTDKPSGPGAALCNWCCTWRGDKVCSSCKRAHYCSEKHQTLHWRSGHRIKCQQLSLSSELPGSSFSNGGSTQTEIIKAGSNTLWPEYEMMNEDENDFDEDEMTDIDNQANSLLSRSKMDDTVTSLMNSFEGDGDKKFWASFQERMAKAPEQVLRYCRHPNAKPLWPMSSGRPSKADIPNCSYCRGPSKFEFQILPQLLYYFGVKNAVDSLDWATLVIYTCEASCEGNVAYKEEFAWVQLYSPSATLC